MLQKREKRARTRRYRIVSKVSGSWMPLWSQGFKVCIHPPLTDEPRIALDNGDLVNVTRWRRHWLFGEKVQENLISTALNGKKNAENEDKEGPKKRARGWFPRQCAVEFFEDNEDDSDEEFEDRSDKKKQK